jgi:hypothetical protein
MIDVLRESNLHLLCYVANGSSPIFATCPAGEIWPSGPFLPSSPVTALQLALPETQWVRSCVSEKVPSPQRGGGIGWGEGRCSRPLSSRGRPAAEPPSPYPPPAGGGENVSAGIKARKMCRFPTEDPEAPFNSALSRLVTGKKVQERLGSSRSSLD